MFSKLLKHDMRSIGRYWWIIAVSTLGLSLVGAFAFRFILETSMNDFEYPVFTILAMLILIGCYLGVIASVIITEILVFLRFYKNFFTDEGYLTFTLPVSRKSLLASKTVNAFIWTLAQVFLLLFCIIFIFGTISTPMSEGSGIINPVLLVSIGDFFIEAWKSVGAWVIVYVIEALVMVGLSTLFSISLAHFCITFGSVIAKKHKLLAAIGIYYVTNMVLSFITQIAAILGMAIIGSLYDADGYYSAVYDINPVIAVLLLIVIAVMAVLAIVMYRLTLRQLERKLNLP
ncbi:MAG: hypothetical protein IJY27_04480 [Clostridia bacterium]|nr:hypothetical protein [Clostridia bacterium]